MPNATRPPKSESTSLQDERVSEALDRLERLEAQVNARLGWLEQVPLAIGAIAGSVRDLPTEDRDDDSDDSDDSDEEN